jgi:hypothetical protein
VREADIVRSACYCLLLDYSAAAPQLLTHVIYRDILSDRGGQWRFVERRPSIDGPVIGPAPCG